MATVSINIDTVSIGVDEDKSEQFVLCAYRNFLEYHFEVLRENAPAVIYPTRKYVLTVTGLEPGEGLDISGESDDSFATVGFICSMVPERDPTQTWVKVTLRTGNALLDKVFGDISLTDEEASLFRFGQELVISLAPIPE